MKKLTISKKQTGAALIVSLVILLVLTILAVTVMDSSVIEEKMAGNYIDSNRVFQAAESTLRQAESVIDSWSSAPIPGQANTNVNNAFVYALGKPNNSSSFNWWLASGSDNWMDGDSNGDEYKGVLSNITSAKYFIEEYNLVCAELVVPNYGDCDVVYRITARAVGGRNISIYLQSLYARKY